MSSFTINYKISGKSKSATQSCDDFELLTKNESCRQTVILRAKKELFLYLFTQSFPFSPAKDDLYFFNGYQSWTDTKERKLSEHERNIKKLPRFLVNAFAFDSYGDSSFYTYGKHLLHGYDIFLAPIFS